MEPAEKRRLLIIGSGMLVHPIWRGLLQAIPMLRAKGYKVKHIFNNHPDNLVDPEIDAFEPEIIIYLGGGYALQQRLPKFAPALRRWASAKRCYWFNDLRPYPWGRLMRGVFDYAFLCWSRSFRHKKVCNGLNFSHERWGDAAEAPVFYMPQGADFFDELYNPPRRFHAVFVGHAGDNRWHRGRAKACEALKVRIVNSPNPAERDENERRMRYLYRQANFVLSISPPVPGYTSVRTFRILATGGLLFLSYYPDSERLFKHREHALVFKDLKQGRKLMHQYAQKGEELERIRLNGWRLQREKHHMVHRLENIVANMTTDDLSFWGWL